MEGTEHNDRGYCMTKILSVIELHASELTKHLKGIYTVKVDARSQRYCLHTN